MLSVHKRSFIRGVLTTKLGVGFSHISICQIYLIKNDCLCKELSIHPLFSNVGLGFYVSLASFFWQLLFFLENLAHDWNLACLEETGVCFGLTVLTPLWCQRLYGTLVRGGCLLAGSLVRKSKAFQGGRGACILFLN